MLKEFIAVGIVSSVGIHMKEIEKWLLFNCHMQRLVRTFNPGTSITQCC